MYGDIMKILISIMKMLPCFILFIPTAYYGLTGLYFRIFEGIEPVGLLSFVSTLIVALSLITGVFVVIVLSIDHTIKVINKLLNN